MNESVNNMSFWDCVGLHMTQKNDCKKETKEIFELFYEGKQSYNSYQGFDLENENISRFESMIGLEVYEILADIGRGKLWDNSKPLFYKDSKNLRLNWLKDTTISKNLMRVLRYKLPDGKIHYSYIKDIQNLQKIKHKCNTCGNTFSDDKDLKKHIPTCEDFKQTDKFVKYPTVYEPKRNLIIELNEIFNTDYDFKFEPVIVYDFEALVLPLNVKIGETTQITNEQRAVSVSICSNI